MTLAMMSNILVQAPRCLPWSGTLGKLLRHSLSISAAQYLL